MTTQQKLCEQECRIGKALGLIVVYLLRISVCMDQERVYEFSGELGLEGSQVPVENDFYYSPKSTSRATANVGF